MFVSFLGLELDPFRPGSPGLSLNLGLFGVRGRSREKAFPPFVLFSSNRLASYWPQIMDEFYWHKHAFGILLRK